MLQRIVLLTYLCVLLFSQHSTAQSLVLAEGPTHIVFEKNIELLEANANSFTLSQLQSLQGEHFQPLSNNLVLQPEQPYWIRFQLVNPLNKLIPLALTLSDKAIHIEGAYIKQNQQWRIYAGLAQNKTLSNYQGLILSVQPESRQWYYLRISAPRTAQLTPTLQDLDSHTTQFTVTQQFFGINIALMFFIAVLHLAALRFHHHVRHYLVVFLALSSGLYGLSHSPLISWPNWLISACDLVPWLLACGLAFSSFSNAYYREYLKSNRSSFVVMGCLLCGLLFVNAAYLTQLLIALVPLTYIFVKSRPASLLLLAACGVLALNILWQICYIIWPYLIIPTSGLVDVSAISLTVLLASFSMTLPYFQRQVRLQTPSNNHRHAQFLSKLSHELRTPMNGVLGMEELLLETPLSTTQRDYVETIGSAGEDMLRLVNRVSDYAKITTGRLNMERRSVDLPELLELILDKFSAIANQKNIEIVLNLDTAIPEHIHVDANHLRNILENVLEHAINRTEFGEVELVITWNEDKYLLFRIRDTGEGLSKTVLKSLFNQKHLLAHLNDVSSEKFALALSKQLIEHLGGTLFIDNQIGEGSSLSFSLPYVAANQPKEAHPLDSILQGLSILIVDDNSTLRKVLQRYAKSWGMHAETTHNGKEALAKLRSQNNINEPFDIILIDQDMPIMSGFDLARKIGKDSEINPNLIKIMLTGLSIDNQTPQVQQAGIHQLLTKPISARALKRNLALHVEKRFLSPLKVPNLDPEHASSGKSS
ncbi:response regulator [Bermanella sp. R86510]|uniref:response regulator n=1 Tax=unclassified Bermanella TaxID=2627862 RepID=UPI0037CB0047